AFSRVIDGVALVQRRKELACSFHVFHCLLMGELVQLRLPGAMQDRYRQKHHTDRRHRGWIHSWKSVPRRRERIVVIVRNAVVEHGFGWNSKAVIIDTSLTLSYYLLSVHLESQIDSFRPCFGGFFSESERMRLRVSPAKTLPAPAPVGAQPAPRALYEGR